MKKIVSSSLKLKVIIAGSRGITGDFYDSLDSLLRKLSSVISIFYDRKTIIGEIVSGGARGADKLGEQWALNNDISIIKFLPDWGLYGKSAGYRRNVEMANYADILVALWDGKSRGTNHMVNIMKDKNEPVIVLTTDMKASVVPESLAKLCDWSEL